MEIGAEQLVRQGGSVDVDPRERVEQSDLSSLEVIHREDALGRVVLDRKGDLEALERLQVPVQSNQVLGLAAIIELADQRAAERVHQPLQAVLRADGGVLVQERRELAQR